MSAVLEALASDRDRAVLHGPGEVVHAGRALDTVYRMARALADRGCGPGTAVALFGPMSPRMFLVSYAVQLAGGALVEVPLAAEDHIRVRLVQECGAGLVVADASSIGAPALQALAEAPGRPLLTLAPADRGEDLWAVCLDHSAEPFTSRARPGDPVRISLTGGTTGRAKPVVRTFGSAPASKAPILERLFTPDSGAPRVLMADRLTGLYKTVADVVLTGGGSCVMLPDYEPVRVAHTVREHAITHMMIPSPQLRRLVEHPKVAADELSGLECVVAGGGAVSPSLIGKAVDLLGPIVHFSYGQTEAGNVSWLTPSDYREGSAAVLRSCGRPSPGVRVRIRGVDGEDLEPYRRGRIWVRTPMMMQGYLGRPEQTAGVLRRGWLDTGDVGFLDEEGYLTVLGRASDAIRIGRTTLFSTEVDALLQEHGAIADSATFDVTEKSGQAGLHAAVVVRRGHRVEEWELRSLVRAHLGPDHEPASVLFVSHIPLTYSHELCWRTLRSWYRDRAPAYPARA